MAQVIVQVGLGHLEDLIRSPQGGLAELIWNAVDADATFVSIAVETTSLGSIEAVTVQDNGTGMTPLAAHRGFQSLGDSWKASEKVSGRDRRVLHGAAGKGRFGAFAIGDRIHWSSIADIEGGRVETVVTGTRSDLSTFDIAEPIPTSDDTGTTVRIEHVTEAAARALDKGTVIDGLAITFALYLESYPVAISWRGDRLDPSELQQFRQTYALDVPGTDGQVALTVIEWTRSVPRAMLLCDGNGMALHEVRPGVQAPGFDFTAYVRWSGFAELGHDLLLAELGHQQVTPVVEAAQTALRQHFKDRALQRQRELVEQWKAEESYPYIGEPQGVIEQAERDLFEVVAVSAAKVVQAADPPARRFSLRLLKEAVESSPHALHTILREVLELPQERLDELHRLLDRTSLTAVISASKTIADRLDFISGVDQILFDADPKRQTLERRQLHRILARETWLFGEEYALTGDDERLTAVLVKHLALLGEEVELADGPPVTREDGTIAIPDLVLSRQLEHHQDVLEHLVVELKRPSVDIGSEQLQQIEDYAFAVASDERFNQPNVRWEFIVVGNNLKDPVRRRASQVGRPQGLVHDGGSVRIWARTWAEIINDARHRLKFVRDSLEYQSSREGGLQYLRDTHAKYLPPALQPDVTPRRHSVGPVHP